MKSNSNGAKAVSKGVISAALSIAAGVAMDVSQSSPCLAQENGTSSCSIDWNKLNLTHAQSEQIKQLEQQWYKESAEIIPQVKEDQVKLQRSLADHGADGVQVISLQQQVSRKKEQLNSLAMQNFLAKKKVLNEDQKKQLEDMVRIAVANRKSQMFPGSQTEVMPDKIQSLMQRVRDIWPVNSDH
jgi:Spy/CpxP family protein refolding chaperone